MTLTVQATLLFNFQTQMLRAWVSPTGPDFQKVSQPRSGDSRKYEPRISDAKRIWMVRRIADGKTSASSFLSSQTDHQQVEASHGDACDHDRVKMTTLLYGFNQSRRIFRLDHGAREDFLAEPRKH